MCRECGAVGIAVSRLEWAPRLAEALEALDAHRTLAGGEIVSHG